MKIVPSKRKGAWTNLLDAWTGLIGVHFDLHACVCVCVCAICLLDIALFVVERGICSIEHHVINIAICFEVRMTYRGQILFCVCDAITIIAKK
jgi:hypothetical protein